MVRPQALIFSPQRRCLEHWAVSPRQSCPYTHSRSRLGACTRGSRKSSSSLEPRPSSGICLEMHAASQQQQRNTKGLPHPRMKLKAISQSLPSRASRQPPKLRPSSGAAWRQHNTHNTIYPPLPRNHSCFKLSASARSRGCRSIRPALLPFQVRRRLHTTLVVSQDQHRPCCCLPSVSVSL